MPTAKEHSDHVQRSKRLLEVLKEKQELPEWIIVAAYYKAVHYAEAMFVSLPQDKDDRHFTDCHDHKERRRQLKRGKFKSVWKHYRPIENWSMLARYLDPRQLMTEGASGPYDLTHASAFKQTWERIVDSRLQNLKKAMSDLVPTTAKAIFV
jgi:hypothetical protein